MRAEPFGYYMKRASQFDADTKEEVTEKAKAWSDNKWPEPDNEPDICPIKRKVRRENFMAALRIEQS